MLDKQLHKIVCFGEVLWDVLPSGAVPGGAPMNVAYHLQKLNNNPALITRIGTDERGADLIKLFIKHGINTEYFQIDEKYGTGIVMVESGFNDDVKYDIIKPVAWDYITWMDSYEKLVSGSEYFVYGSLAARNEVSKNSLFKILEIAKYKVLDINLRAPHFDQQLIDQLIHKADFVKMNFNELEFITSRFSSFKDIEDKMKSFSDKYKLSKLVVTMGGNGALLLVDDIIIKHQGYKVEIVDTIGSGDAFLAGLLSKSLENKTFSESLEFANAIGALVATHRGACPDYDINEIYDLIKK